VATGHTNSAAEGVNRLIKLVYRSRSGLTNVTNQQRRSRYAASRGTRSVWLSVPWHQQHLRQHQVDAAPAPALLLPQNKRSDHAELPGEPDDRRLHTITTGRTQSVAA
jgi:transposase